MHFAPQDFVRGFSSGTESRSRNVNAPRLGFAAYRCLSQSLEANQIDVPNDGDLDTTFSQCGSIVLCRRGKTRSHQPTCRFLPVHARGRSVEVSKFMITVVWVYRVISQCQGP